MSETATQEFEFQAEIAQLLHLLSHSLYQNKEIAIRELVSNASDAIDRYRHVALQDSEQSTDDLGLFLEPDSENKVLTIRDNGIGMTQDELVKNLGTIAHSGSLEFLSKLAESDNKDDVSLIGQFGVGFYSAFMLAGKVEGGDRRFGFSCVAVKPHRLVLVTRRQEMAVIDRNGGRRIAHFEIFLRGMRARTGHRREQGQNHRRDHRSHRSCPP